MTDNSTLPIGRFGRCMPSRTRAAWAVLLVFAFSPASRLDAETLRRAATSTLTAVELDEGDVLEFTLQNGEQRKLELLETWARVVLTNLETPRKGFPGGGTVYAFGCRVRIDGQPMTMIRYVPVQASFYEPYVVDGVRIWFDGVRKIGEMFNENHGACVPRKSARFALQDATLPICAEEELRPWYPNPGNFIDVHTCYNGDDVWMGTYFGADLHGGLDINMPISTPLWAPIGFDDQFYFNSLAAGHNNNRWRAIRRWENGQRWVLQAHHITRLLVPEHTPLERGAHYAQAAGVLTGSHAHSHFVFKVGEPDDEVLLDPWILFWQIFENNRRRASAIRAGMAGCAPVRTAQPVTFEPSSSQPGVSGNGLRYHWTFGDGGHSLEDRPAYVFSRAGMYPVTLVVSDGTKMAATTQHISVSGDAVETSALALHAPDEIEFVKRPVPVMDVYGFEPRFPPHTLRFAARPRNGPRPAGKQIRLENLGSGTLATAVCRVEYQEGEGWARVVPQGQGNSQRLEVSVDASGFKPKHGIYRARVHVACPGAANCPQVFTIQLTVPPSSPATEVIVDDRDDGCYVSPYCWLAPRFHGPWPEGYRGRYLVAGSGPHLDGIVRFQPDLAPGIYEVSLHEQTPIRPTKQTSARIRYRVRVRHARGTESVWMEPLKSRRIGTFEFARGTGGYVQIETRDAEGLVVADAVRFRRIEAAEP